MMMMMKLMIICRPSQDGEKGFMLLAVNRSIQCQIMIDTHTLHLLRENILKYDYCTAHQCKGMLILLLLCPHKATLPKHAHD
mmetsp:Transcript_59335/g.98312  ORF Transcript_59335/g.98312 Transcript_59335/m.98312 type:complete len:82 (+) Transcript_59335:743-988(+)